MSATPEADDIAVFTSSGDAAKWAQVEADNLKAVLAHMGAHGTEEPRDVALM